MPFTVMSQYNARQLYSLNIIQRVQLQKKCVYSVLICNHWRPVLLAYASRKGSAQKDDSKVNSIICKHITKINHGDNQMCDIINP